jgi:transcriptional regulator with XRE-family HTH domain
MTESERLKEIRKVLDLTQREMSDALEIKQGSYSDVERGKAGISALLLKNLIRKYRVNPLWLCEGEGSMFIGHQETAFFKPIDPSKFNKNSEQFTANTPGPTSSNEEIDNQIDLVERQQQYLENLTSLIEFLKKK